MCSYYLFHWVWFPFLQLSAATHFLLLFLVTFDCSLTVNTSMSCSHHQRRVATSHHLHQHQTTFNGNFSTPAIHESTNQILTISELKDFVLNLKPLLASCLYSRSEGEATCQSLSLQLLNGFS